MTLKLLKTIIEALERGCTVKVKARNSEKMIDIQIIEPKALRYPTYEEVFKWFKENKVFIHQTYRCYVKINMMHTMRLVDSVGILQRYFSIKEFVDSFTDENGNSLMIQD